jgi:hypothetical protein
MDTGKWTLALDEITNQFRNEFGGLSQEQLNWRPDGKTWSVGQNIDHLVVINKTYVPVIQSVRDNTYKLPWVGKVGFLVRFFGNFILKSVQPDRKNKMKTFPIWEPIQSSIQEDVIDKFSVCQEELKQLIRSSQDLVTRNVVISSPANKNIVYTLACAFDIIVTHERRHLEQAREVYNLQMNRM